MFTNLMYIDITGEFKYNSTFWDKIILLLSASNVFTVNIFLISLIAVTHFDVMLKEDKVKQRSIFETIPKIFNFKLVLPHMLLLLCYSFKSLPRKMSEDIPFFKFNNFTF